MLSIYKYYKEATVDYMLRRHVKIGFYSYQLIPPKKYIQHPVTRPKNLPVKVPGSVTFVPLLMAD